MRSTPCTVDWKNTVTMQLGRQHGECWVAVADEPPPLTPEGFGAGWEHIGTAPGSREVELSTEMNRCFNGQRPKKLKIDFYLDADPSSPVAQEMLKPKFQPSSSDLAGRAIPEKFWLGIDMLGGGTRLLITRVPAYPAVSIRRPPAPHPGLINQGKPICIGIRTDEHCVFFDRVELPS